MPSYYGMPIIRTGKCHCWEQLGKQPPQSYALSLETWFSAEALLFSLALLVTAPLISPAVVSTPLLPFIPSMTASILVSISKASRQFFKSALCLHKSHLGDVWYLVGRCQLSIFTPSSRILLLANLRKIVLVIL